MADIDACFECWDSEFGIVRVALGKYQRRIVYWTSCLTNILLGNVFGSA